MKRSVGLLAIAATIFVSACTTINGSARIEHFPTDAYCGFKMSLNFDTNDPGLRLSRAIWDFSHAENIGEIRPTCNQPHFTPCDIAAAECKGVIHWIFPTHYKAPAYYFDEFPPGDIKWAGAYLSKPGGGHSDYVTGNDLVGTALYVYFSKNGEEVHEVRTEFERSAQDEEVWKAAFKSTF